MFDDPEMYEDMIDEPTEDVLEESVTEDDQETELENIDMKEEHFLIEDHLLNEDTMEAKIADEDPGHHDTLGL
jgi:hypothetical protein